jgi:penicillin-binding protein
MTIRAATRTDEQKEDRAMSHRSHPKRTAALVLLSAALLFSGCGGDETSAPLSEDPPLDEQPPLAPSGLALGIEGTTKFSFTWQPNTEADLAGYRVYLYAPDPGREDAYVCVTGERLLTRTSMTYVGESGTTYIFKVSAVDISQKESARSEAFTYTFAGAPEGDLPADQIGGDGQMPPEGTGDGPGNGGRDLPMDLPVK